MMDKVAFLFLTRNWIWSRLTYKDVKKRYLEECKENRKKLGIEKAIEEGWGLYDKKSPTFDSVLQTCIDAGYVEFNWDHRFNEPIKCGNVTPQGYNYLYTVYTDNNSQEFKNYADEIKKEMNKLNFIPYDRFDLAEEYWKGTSIKNLIENYSKSYCWNNTFRDSQYHLEVLKLNGLTIDEEEYLFHLRPKLFLPRALVGESVELEIEGLSLPQNFTLTQPFPNKRYHVGGLKIGRKSTHAGFYPLHFKPNKIPESLSFELKWTIGGEYQINHLVKVKFIDKGYGRLFTTSQLLSKGNLDIPTFDLITYCEEEFWEDCRGRDVEWMLDMNNYTKLIEENLTLTGIPFELQFQTCVNKDL
ncbi:hypothetical protein ABD87_15035 [Lysinibacillus sphaericus]|uniref:hypothetical protein n=1 Tax=Lysinibacillus sphaericus TaxID=1421 RepID=UPI0018CD2E0E|nr:hypothetical protein [Lysinibacillus sphaericus]MBG9730805.1 hypothetical protein [Lysinibacillus sphaericus]